MSNKLQIIPAGVSGVTDDAYLVITRIKNNLILRRMKKLGYKSVAEFCRKNQIPQSNIGMLVNFRRLPIKENGDWKDDIWDLSSALHCEPEELFTETQKTLISKKRAHIQSLSEERFLGLADYSRERQLEDLSGKELLEKISTTLTPREEEIIKQRFFESQTLEEVGNDFNRSRDRIRQIEGRALRKMQRENYVLEKHQKWQNENNVIGKKL